MQSQASAISFWISLIPSIVVHDGSSALRREFEAPYTDKVTPGVLYVPYNVCLFCFLSPPPTASRWHWRREPVAPELSRDRSGRAPAWPDRPRRDRRPSPFQSACCGTPAATI